MTIGINCLRPNFRSWLVGAAAVAAIFAGGIAFLSGRLDGFRPRIQADLQTKLKRPVTLGHLGLKLFPLSIEIQGFSIAEDAAFARARPFATASQVFVSTDLLRLLGGNLQVNEMILNQPRIELIENAAGKWNFSSLGARGGGDSSGSSFALDDLQIKDGQVALTDALHPGAQGIYDHIDLTVKDFGCVLGGKASAKGDIELAKTMMRGSKLDFPIKAKFALSADQAFDNVSIQYLNLALGAATLQASGSVSKGALDLRVNTNDSSLREVAMLAGAAGVVFNPDYKIDGRLTLDVSARGPANNPQLNGKITLKNVNASGGHLKEAVSTPEIDVALTPQSIVTNTFAAKSGPAALSGSLTLMNYRTAHPVFQFALALDRIDTEELKGLMAKNSAHAQGDSASLLETILTNATGGGTLSVKRLQARQILLSALSTTVKLDHGLVTLSPLSADAFHGKISGSVGADIRPGMPGFSLDAKLTGVDANALLSAVSSMKNELYGTLDARTKLKFALASGGDLAKSLNGTVDFSLANGELKNADILGEVSKFLNLMGGKGAPPGSGSSTQLKQFSGTLNIANGVAATNNLKASTVSGTIAAKGSLNLVNEALDLHMTVGTGLLAMPVLVTGTTAHMKFAPDLEALAKMKLGGVMGSIFGALGQKKQ